MDYDNYFDDWLAIATSGRADRSFFADETFFTDSQAAGDATALAEMDGDPEVLPGDVSV